ncbi:MFS family permease [Allocatelliglobosispora scoriae]|uniref:MFS family permease n=1 Tax=Allocatelliglobosispora scoriae TaxID=643052 RepID=A0A841BIX7_9ACTN|nr:MFS transporter [Allocatelliglobosispora scoriae]MBB5867278.1 MFS family permease [Allocatelliglobosispora scoriae]
MANRLIEKLVPARLGSSYRWLLASSWTTNFGDGVAMAAGPLLVASLTDDALLISLAAMLAWAPPLLFSLYAGVLSDRLDRRRIVLVADGSRVVILAVLFGTVVAGTVTVTGALIALGLLATAEVFADNTSATLTPMLVSRDDLAIANARLQTGFLTLNQLAGPPLGAALFVVGIAWPFATQAVLVAAGLVMVSRIKPPPHGRQLGVERRSLRRDLAEGFRWTVHHAAVRTLALTILMFNVTFGAAWSVLVLYAHQRLGLGAIGFGLLTTVSAAGGLLGTGLYGWITARVSLGNIMRIGLIIETLTHLGLALTTSPWVASGIFFLFGAHAFVWGTTSVTVRQRAVPTELQGRVGSLNTISVFGGLVVGSAIGGVLGTRYGVTAPFWFAFAGSAVFVVVLWRQLSRIAHDDENAAEEAQRAPAQNPVAVA